MLQNQINCKKKLEQKSLYNFFTDADGYIFIILQMADGMESMSSFLSFTGSRVMVFGMNSGCTFIVS